MSATRSTPSFFLMSVLIQPGAMWLPHPQLSLRTVGCSGCIELLEQPAQHLLRIEELLRQGPCFPRVAPAVFEDRLGAGDRLLDRGERDQALTHRQALPEAGVLDQDRPATGEKAGAAVAEPAAGGLDVDVLRDPDLRRG